MSHLLRCYQYLLISVVAVSVPGRLDGQQDDAMRKGDMNPKTNSLIPDKGTKDASYNLNRSRTLVNPSGCEHYLGYQYWIRYCIVP